MSISTSSNGYMAELTNIAAKLALPMHETDRLVEKIIPDILRAIYRYPQEVNKDGEIVLADLTEEEKEINADVERYYKERYGRDFPPYQRKIRATALFGPPGHGKTSVMEVASRTVAKGMGWRYISAEQLDLVPIEEIDHKTFVFVSHETAGAVSAMDFVGLPASEEIAGTKDKYMSRLFNLQMHKMQRAGGATFLLDDVLNAPRHIQDTTLSITDRRRYGQLNFGNAFICLTGNLGALDDSNATRAASPLRGRVKSSLAHDTVENFLARTRSNPLFRDELGDVFVRQFFYRYPHLFSAHPVRGQQGGFASPRSWEGFIHDGRDILYQHGGREHARAARMDLVEAAEQSLGPEVAQNYNAFLEAVLTMADPLARQIIKEGKLDEKTLRDQYAEGGFSGREQQFAYQFAMALVDYGVQKIIEDDSLDEAILRFGNGLAVMSEDVFAFAIEELKSKLSAQVDTVNKGKLKVATVNSQGKRKLDSTAGEKIGEIIMSTGKVDATRRATLISVLSDMNKFSNRATAPGKRTRRKD